MKKIIFIVVFTILLTGCSSQYNLKFEDGKISEEIVTTISNSDIPKLTPEDEALGLELDDPITPFIEMDQYPFADNEDIKYDKTVNKTVSSTIVTLKYDYTLDEYNKSQAKKLCFQSSSFSDGKTGAFFSASGKFYCLYGDEVQINFTTDRKVTEHNADKVNGNTYTWIINRDNQDNVNIDIKMPKEEIITQETKTNFTLLIIGLIILVSGLFLYMKFKQGKEANRL